MWSTAIAVVLAKKSWGGPTRLAEVLFIQILRAHIASEPERNQAWLRAIFDPQVGAALKAVHDRVNTPWTVESLAESAGMSRSAFAARFKELLGQTPLASIERLTDRLVAPAVEESQTTSRWFICFPSTLPFSAAV